jgi:hypothetical protein
MCSKRIGFSLEYESHVKMIIPEISASKVAGLIGLHKFQNPAEIMYGLLLKDASSRSLITQLEEAHQRRPFQLVVNEILREQPIQDIVSTGIQRCKETREISSVLRAVEDQANIVFDLRYDQFDPEVRSQLIGEIRGKVSRQRGLNNEEAILNQYETHREVKVTERNTKTIKKSFDTFILVGRCDGYVASENRIVDSKERTRVWPTVPLYDEIQLRCYMNMYGAKESELVERFPDGNVRHTKYLNDPKKWDAIESAMTLAVAKMNMALNDPDELKRIVFANTVVTHNVPGVHQHGAPRAASPASLDV